MALRQRLVLDVSGYRQSLRQAQQEMRRFSQESKKHGRAVGDGVTEGARTAEREWTRSTGRIGQAMTRLKGLILAAFAAASVKAFGSALLDANAAVQNLERSFTSLTGSADVARSLLREIEALSKSSSLAFEELAGTARTLLAYGTRPDDLVARLEAFQDTASALDPGAVEFTMNRIVLAIGQMEAKGKVSGEEMRQLTEAGLPAWDLLARAVGRTTAEVQEMTQRGLIPATEAVEALISGMGTRYRGAAAQMAGGFTGIVANLRDEARSAFRDIGGELFKAVEGDLKNVLASIRQMRESGELTAIFQQIGNTIAGVYRAMKSVVQATAEWGPTLATVGAGFAAFQVADATLGRVGRAFAEIRKQAKLAHDNEIAKLNQAIRDNRRYLAEIQSMPQGALASGRTYTWGEEVAEVNRELANQQRRLQALQTQGVTTFGRLRTAAGAWFKSFFSWGNVLTFVGTIVASLAIQWALTAREVDKVTRKLREQRDAAREVLDEIRKIPGAMAASQQMEMRLELRINTDRLEEIDAEIARLQQRMIDTGKAERDPSTGQLRARSGYQLSGPNVTSEQQDINKLRKERGELVQTIEAQERAESALDRVATNSLEGQRRRLEMQLQLERDKAELTRQELDALQQIERDRQRIRDDASVGETAASRIIEQLRDAEQAIHDAALGRIDQALVTDLEAQLEAVEARMRQRGLLPVETSDGGGGGGTGTGRDEIREAAERYRALQAEVQAQERLVGLRGDALSKMQEANALYAEAAAFEERMRQAAADGNWALAERLQVVSQLKQEQASAAAAEVPALQAQVEETERLEALWQSLPAHVQQMIGTAEELADMLKEIDIETLGVDVGDLLGDIDVMTASLNDRLEDVQDRLARGLIDRKQAQKEAEALRDEYLKVFGDLYDRLQPLLAKLPDGIADAIKEALRELRDAAYSEGDAPDWAGQLREAEAYANGVIDLAHAFGMLDDEAASALKSIADLSVGVGRIASGDVAGGITQAVSGLVGIISGMGEDKAEIKRLSDSIRRNVQALEDNTRALMESAQIGADLTRAQVEAAEQAIALMERGAATGSMSRFTRGLQALEESGIPGTENLTDLFSEAFNLIKEKDGAIAAAESMDALVQAMLTGDFSALPRYVQELFAGFDGLRDAIDDLAANLGAYSDTVGGAVERSRDRQQYLGLEGQDAYADFFAGIGDGLEDAMSAELQAILNEMKGLDLSTAEGRRRFEELVALAYGLGVSGDAGLSADDVEAMLSHLQSIAQGITDPRSETSRTVQSVRSITEYQGDLLIGIQREALHVLRGIRASLSTALPGISVPHIPDPSAASTRALQGADRAVRATTSHTVNVTNHVDLDVNGLGVMSIDDLLREIDRRVRSHPRLR